MRLDRKGADMSASQRGGVPETSGFVIHWASRYELLTKLVFLGREQAFREATLDLVPIEPGQSVLDVGCGPGSLTLAAKRRVGRGTVCGIDPAPEMIALARAKSARAGEAVDFRVGVIEDLPFEDGSFDVALSSLMLHHLPLEPRRRGLAEVRRVLKPGGTCLVVDLEHHGHGPLARLRSHVVGSRRALDPGVGELMREVGFEVTTGPTRHRLIRYARGISGRG
jgi:ubiquinone/menaquinone biosynthesis C-methylase UbiE